MWSRPYRGTRRSWCIARAAIDRPWRPIRCNKWDIGTSCRWLAALGPGSSRGGRSSIERDAAHRAVRAAVVAVLRRREPVGLELLMIKRAEHDRDPWSGHVALPGGREE